MLKNNESKLVGQWIFENGEMRGDVVTERIDWLVHNHLKKAGNTNNGWDILYVDPDDGRMWELTYPESELHGGGPPTLELISPNDAKRKYPSM